MLGALYFVAQTDRICVGGVSSVLLCLEQLALQVPLSGPSIFTQNRQWRHFLCHMWLCQRERYTCIILSKAACQAEHASCPVLRSHRRAHAHLDKNHEQ